MLAANTTEPSKHTKLLRNHGWEPRHLYRLVCSKTRTGLSRYQQVTSHGSQPKARCLTWRCLFGFRLPLKRKQWKPRRAPPQKKKNILIVPLLRTGHVQRQGNPHQREVPNMFRYLFHGTPTKASLCVYVPIEIPNFPSWVLLGYQVLSPVPEGLCKKVQSKWTGLHKHSTRPLGKRVRMLHFPTKGQESSTSAG